MCPGDSCDIFMKNVSGFCPFLKSLLKSKLWSLELILMAEKNLKKGKKEKEKTTSILSVKLLLVVTLSSIYNEKWQTEHLKNEKYRKFKSKRSTWMRNGIKSCV